jgi:hypothetical protein
MKILVSKEFEKIELFLQGIPSSPTHWPEWNTTISKFYNTDFYYLIAVKHDKIIGVCPVHSDQKKPLNRLYSGQFMYIPYGGWLLNRSLPIGKEFFPVSQNQSLLSFSLPITNIYPSYSLAGKDKPAETLLIDLNFEENYIWENYIDSKRRNMIRKAEKYKLEIELVTQDNFDLFYEFYITTYKRYGLISLNKECLFELFFNLKMINFRTTIIKFEEQIISGLVMVYDKTLALYWLGLNAEKMPNFGQGEILQWDAIKHAKSYGCQNYDLCYIEKERLPSIYEFKKGFSKVEAPIQIINIRSLGYKIINRILR